jgi:hypothetical protein
MSEEEGSHTLPDGTQLYTKTFKVLWSRHVVGLHALT